MSRVMAAREKRSAGVCWVVEWVFRGVEVVVVVVEEDVEGGDVAEGGGEVMEDEVVEDEVEEVMDGFGMSDLAVLAQMPLRCGLICFCGGLCVIWLAFELPPEDEEDVEKAKEKRVGEPGSPIRMTVPFDAAESGLVKSGDEGGLSLRGSSASLDGFWRLAVRPPDGSMMRLDGSGWTGATAGWTGAVVRAQRSGAEYW